MIQMGCHVWFHQGPSAEDPGSSQPHNQGKRCLLWRYYCCKDGLSRCTSVHRAALGRPGWVASPRSWPVGMSSPAKSTRARVYHCLMGIFKPKAVRADIMRVPARKVLIFSTWCQRPTLPCLSWSATKWQAAAEWHVVFVLVLLSMCLDRGGELSTVLAKLWCSE